MVIIRRKNGSPDMILTAFDMKFHAKTDEIPPRACRPSKKMKQKQCRKKTWVTNASPDMILTAFDMKFHEK